MSLYTSTCKCIYKKKVQNYTSCPLKVGTGSNFYLFLPYSFPLLIPPLPLPFPSFPPFSFPPFFLFIPPPHLPSIPINILLPSSPPPCHPNKDENYKLQFVDCLMKTYTSEAVFLLTTFVNMARARPADCDKEKQFINTIALEIFEVQLQSHSQDPPLPTWE